MQKKWWEGFVSFLVDYWFIWLPLIALAVTAYFTRNLWLPLL
jgi:hypothetical protein